MSDEKRRGILGGLRNPAKGKEKTAAQTTKPRTPLKQEEKEKITIGDEVGNKGLGRLSLSATQFETINSILASLVVKTKCPAVILTDHSGLVIATDGSMGDENFPTLAALSAADYAATSEMSRLIGETEGFKMHYHEGPNLSVYVTGVIAQFIIVLVFNKDTTFGMVKVLSTKAVKELVQVFTEIDQSVAKRDAADMNDALNDNEFNDELTSRLDAALTGKKDWGH